ncbi:hypothetical protein Tco_1072097 [Tanacetum coccineum]
MSSASSTAGADLEALASHKDKATYLSTTDEELKREDGICGERQTGGDELVVYPPAQQRASYEVLADIQMDYSHPKKFGYKKDNQAESNSGRKSNNSAVEAKSTSRNASASVSKLGLRMKGKMKANDQDKLGLLSSSSTLIVDDEETHVLKQFVTGKVIKYVNFMNGFQYKKSNNNMSISCIEVAMLEEDSPAVQSKARDGTS